MAIIAVVGNFLQNAGREIFEAISLFTTWARVILDGSSLLGRNLVTALVGTVSFVRHAFQEFCTFSTIIIEDFYAFTLEASQTITAIANSLYSTYMWINQSVCSGLNSVAEAACLVGNKLCGMYAAISYGVTEIAAAVFRVLQLLKSAVILIGNIPIVTVNGIVAGGQAILSFVSLTLKIIFGIPCQAGLLLLNSGKNAVTFFTDIPVSSYCGLLAGYVAVYSFWRFRRLWTTPLFGALRAFRSIAWQASNGFVILAGLVSNRATSLLAQLASRIALLFRNDERLATEDEDISDTVDAPNINLPRTSTPLPSSSGTTQAKLNSKVGRITESTLDDSVNQSLLRELERERDTRLCIVCLASNKCMNLLPCRHVCLCEVCCSAILASPSRACPVCREPVQRAMLVYL